MNFNRISEILERHGFYSGGGLYEDIKEAVSIEQPKKTGSSDGLVLPELPDTAAAKALEALASKIAVDNSEFLKSTYSTATTFANGLANEKAQAISSKGIYEARQKFLSDLNGKEKRIMELEAKLKEKQRPLTDVDLVELVSTLMDLKRFISEPTKEHSTSIIDRLGDPFSYFRQEEVVKTNLEHANDVVNELLVKLKERV